MDVKQEPTTSAQVPEPAFPAIGRERIGMPDDSEQTSTAAARERGGGTETGANTPATRATTKELMDILRGMSNQVGQLKEANEELKASQIAMEKRLEDRDAGPADFYLAANDLLDESKQTWILDSGSSRQLVSDFAWLENPVPCDDKCTQPNGKSLSVTMKGSDTLTVTAGGRKQIVALSDGYFSKKAVHNLISYDELDKKGCSLTRKNGQRVVVAEDGRVVFDVGIRRNVLTVIGTVIKKHQMPSEVIMNSLNAEATGTNDASSSVHKGTLVEFHRRLRHLSYDAVERVFLAKMKAAAAKQFGHLLVFFEERFDCMIHVLRTDSGGGYQNVDLFTEQGYIVGVGEEVKGYGVYLPKDKKVITTQHVKNIETMDKVQNEQVQK
ncbi:RxLR effector protein [Phytophthora megakarya]|uniref:RxLR effector protein n=1 Tax=Phytophthora megakarya TaxID=4795 RepID=A0A225VKK1_9STRA|nr:RxLR effector protein [Phytophthora megakarya]